MLKFDIIQGKVRIDPQNVLMIPELKNLFDLFQGEVRDRVFTYVHVVARLDPAAPFFSSDAEELPQLAKRNYFSNTIPFPEDKTAIIDLAVNAYIRAYETPDVRILKLFDDKIDEIKKMIKDTTPQIAENHNPTNGAITFTSNIDIITKAMEKIDGLLVVKERLEAKIKNQTGNKGSIRGGKQPSMLEKRSILKNPATKQKEESNESNE
jgi:hypothetical protein